MTRIGTTTTTTITTIPVVRLVVRG